MVSTDPFEPDDIPLPQFPDAHVTDQQAELVFRTLLVPEWIQRKIERDYGLDFEIEYSKQGLVTGPKALIQVKGLHAIPWTLDGRLTYRCVKVSSTHYWLRQNNAVMLVVADVSERSAFYVSAKSYIRAHYETLMEERPVPFRLDKQFQVLDRADPSFYLDVLAEENLERRDAAIGELLSFQSAFHHFHKLNYRRDPHMPVDSADRVSALRDLVVDCSRLSKALGETLFLNLDFTPLADWRPENAGNVFESDLTLWLDRMDRALTKMVQSARHLVLERERAYWAAKLPEIVDKVQRLSQRTAETWTRDAWAGVASHR
ncbi:DUF4365 domain-containing protein [Paraburkholderia sediminicola]|uniref:DUF4365 domain-containing protein n=1 Tax=Paraburkholderia sediminicola TaxID=458836 RepID=UPI0038BDA0D7